MTFSEILLYMNKDAFALWGNVVVFLALFIESLPFIGAFIPGGTIILLLAGILAKWKFFILWEVAIVAIIASITIDTFNYCFGRKVSKRVFHKLANKLFIKQSVLDRMSRMTHAYIGKMIIFGKISPVTRSIGPFIIGSEKVDFKKFFFYDVVGGILWVLVFLGVGYVLGEGIKSVSQMKHIVLGLTMGIVACFYLYSLLSLKLTGTVDKNIN